MTGIADILFPSIQQTDKKDFHLPVSPRMATLKNLFQTAKTTHSQNLISQICVKNIEKFGV